MAKTIYGQEIIDTFSTNIKININEIKNMEIV